MTHHITLYSMLFVMVYIGVHIIVHDVDSCLEETGSVSANLFPGGQVSYQSRLLINVLHIHRKMSTKMFARLQLFAGQSVSLNAQIN